MSKVTIRKQAESSYTPTVIEITLETEDDYNGFIMMARSNVSVPNAICGITEKVRKAFKEILDRINMVT